MEAILSSKFADFGNGPRRAITFPMFGDGIFTQDGEPWRHSRDILRPQLFHRQYENLEVFEEPLNDLLTALPEKGGIVDLQPLFFRYTLDVTTAFLFGDSIRSLKSSDNATENVFARAFDLAQGYVAKRFRLLDLYWLIGGKEFRDACKMVHRYVFLKSVAKSCPDREALRGQIINILAAGRDTTACMLSWTLHPHVMEKLRAEIAQLPPIEGVDRAALRDLKYLQNVMKENLYGMDAEIFRPERWDEELPMNQDPTLQKWGYLPFNGGPRICLGMDFALTEVAYTIVRMLQRYPIIKLPNGERVDVTRLFSPCRDSNGITCKTSAEATIKEERATLTTVFEGEDPLIDIVAVHGLNGDAFRTFTAEKTGKFWLEDSDMLPHDLKGRCRVLTFSYPASVASILGRTSSDRILQHATTLVAELVADREALIYSASRTGQKIEHIHSIYVSTYGILFFGTPHQGTSKTNLATFAQRMVALVPSKVVDTDSQLLSALQESSEVLQDITDNFVPMMKRFRICFFWEQEKTSLGVKWDYVVTENSAAPILDNTDRAGLRKDHRNMCRFATRASPGYNLVVATVLRYSREAPGTITRRWASEREILTSMRKQEAMELIKGVGEMSGEKLKQ
ncbi:hypothetical protein DL769_000422 [Monosporascus sp. CRB-8-3]|nr:hypothetical protein DL769_000422 [Monosporascus sp. CRB-8-3]